MLAQSSFVYCIFVTYFDLKSGVAAARPPASFFQKAVLVLLLHIKFSIVFSIFPKCHWDLSRGGIKSVDCFG